jgi:hypothetical protein
VGALRDAERQDLENQRNGLLRELLDSPLPGELEQLVADDEARAEEGLVELNNPDGKIYYKHIEALSSEDRSDS